MAKVSNIDAATQLLLTLGEQLNSSERLNIAKSTFSERIAKNVLKPILENQGIGSNQITLICEQFSVELKNTLTKKVV